MPKDELEPPIGHLFELYKDDGLPPLIVGGVISAFELRRAASDEGHVAETHDLGAFDSDQANIA